MDEAAVVRLARAAGVPADRARFFLEAAAGDETAAAAMLQGERVAWEVGRRSHADRASKTHNTLTTRPFFPHTDHAADAPRAPRARSPARRAPPRPPAPGARRPARAPAAGGGVSNALASLLRLPLDVAAVALAAARVLADVTLRGVAAVLPPGLGNALRGE